MQQNDTNRMEDDLLTAAECARVLCVSRQRWAQLCLKGLAPVHSLVIRRGMGVTKIWTREQVEEFKMMRNATLVSKNATPC